MSGRQRLIGCGVPAEHPIARYDWERSLLASDLPWSVKSVGLLMATFGNRDGTRVFPSVETLCGITGYSDSGVRKNLKKLRAAGWLFRYEIGSDKGGGVPDRHVLARPISSREDRYWSTGGEERTGTGVPVGLPTGMPRTGTGVQSTGTGVQGDRYSSTAYQATTNPKTIPNPSDSGALPRDEREREWRDGIAACGLCSRNGYVLMHDPNTGDRVEVYPVEFCKHPWLRAG